MREFSIEDNLKSDLIKLSKKDKAMYESPMKKIDEILKCELLQHLKRIHVKRPFVMTFKYLESNDKIIFYDFDNHNNSYKKK